MIIASLQEVMLLRVLEPCGRVVKAYGREDHELGRARVIVRQLVTQALIAIRMRAASGPTTEALSGIGIGLVIYVSIVSIYI